MWKIFKNPKVTSQVVTVFKANEVLMETNLPFKNESSFVLNSA